MYGIETIDLNYFLGNSTVKSSIATANSKDTCLSLFQGLGRILYKKGLEFLKKQFCLKLLILDSEENSTDENKKQPEVKGNSFFFF